MSSSYIPPFRGEINIYTSLRATWVGGWVFIESMPSDEQQLHIPLPGEINICTTLRETWVSGWVFIESMPSVEQEVHIALLGENQHLHITKRNLSGRVDLH